MFLLPGYVNTYVTWGISFYEISSSLNCCVTGLWHPVDTNYVFKKKISAEEGFFPLRVYPILIGLRRPEYQTGKLMIKIVSLCKKAEKRGGVSLAANLFAF